MAERTGSELDIVRFVSDGAVPDLDELSPLERGGWLLDQGFVDEAEACYRAGLAAGCHGCGPALAALYEDLDRINEAIAAWCGAIEVEVPGARAHLAKLLRRLGFVEEALELHRVAIDVGDLSGIAAFARLLAEQNRPEEAVAVCRILFERDVSPRQVPYWPVGDFLRRQGRTAELLDVYQRAVAAGETSTRHRLARLLSDLGRVDEAIAVARAGIEAGDATAYLVLGFVLARHGRRAEETAERARLVAEGSTQHLMTLVTGLGQGELARPRD